MSERTTIDVIMVEPMKPPRMVTLNDNLESMQEAVGGWIEEYMPFTDEVALICNEEGKLMGLPLNRALRDDKGRIYDVVAGTFLLTGLSEENFASLSPELTAKYEKRFRRPELFIPFGGKMTVIPMQVPKEANRNRNNHER